MVSLCSIKGIVSTERPMQGVHDLKNAGFTSALFDFGMFAGAQWVSNGKYRADLMRKYFERTLEAFQTNQILLPAAKFPFLSPYSMEKGLNSLILQINRECISAAEAAGCSRLIVQPLFLDIERGREWEVNREYYLFLAGQCKNAHTKILLINQCRNIGGHLVRGICADGVQAAQWVDRLNQDVGMERFGFCLDVGVCNLCGQDMHPMALALGNRIQAVILTENNGMDEAKLLPFSHARQAKSTLDWLGLFRGLRECGFDGYLILEAVDTLAAYSPLLRPQLIAFCRPLMDYFEMQVGMENVLKKYTSIVLFGAGNMCRAYMKCYGKKYPPLFTCDNNPKLWGTEFEGLEVRNPEALRALPEGCGVFICNIYYREIEAQLEEMGIGNIEYFNDEYMPSFYFDRLERV